MTAKAQLNVWWCDWAILGFPLKVIPQLFLTTRHLLRAPRPYLVRLIGKDFLPLLCRAFPLKRPFAQLQVLQSWVPDNAEVASVRITVFLLRVRAEGLMILLPGTDNVRELLDALNTADPGAPLLYTPVAVTCETPRRRNVGEIDLFLVDLPWSWLAYFRSGAVLRGSPLELVSIKSGQATVHPIQEAAQAAADLWIATAHPELLESGLGEYVTVAEDLGGLLRDDAALGASWRNCSCPGPAASAPPAGPSIGGAAARSSGFAEELETCFLRRSPEFSKPL